MRIKRTILPLIALLSITSAHADLLRDFCLENGGEMMDGWSCPASGFARSGPFCKVKNDQGQDLVFNGCTGMNGKFATLFFNACVIHDFCYHNEPGATGRSRADCDRSLYNDSLAACEAIVDEDERNGCQGAARLFWMGVRVGGKKSWACSKESAAYPMNLADWGM